MSVHLGFKWLVLDNGEALSLIPNVKYVMAKDKLLMLMPLKRFFCCCLIRYCISFLWCHNKFPQTWWLKNKFVSPFQGHKSEVTVLAVMVPPGGSEGESVTCLCPSVQRLCAALAGQWFGDAHSGLCPCLQWASLLPSLCPTGTVLGNVRPALTPGWSCDHINSELPTETLSK